MRTDPGLAKALRPPHHDISISATEPTPPCHPFESSPRSALHLPLNTALIRIMVTQWYSSFAIPQLQPDPNLSLYLFQDKALEQLVYATQIQWLGVENGSANGNGDSGAAARKENGVLRWLGESVLRGLTGVLLTTMFPELEVGPLDVRKPQFLLFLPLQPTGAHD